MKSINSHYQYRCFSCSREYSAKEIETEEFYLCPACGKAEKNRPLQGVLLVEYDYGQIRRKIKSQDFHHLPPGQPWLYPELWPLEFNAGISEHIEALSQKQLAKLSLPSNQIMNVKFNGRDIFILDDTRNPTFSYKDRASILVALKAMQMGIQEIAAASTGNAGSSLAGICARLGLQSHIWVPRNIPENKRLQIQGYGGQLHLVDGAYDTAFDLCLEIAAHTGWYNRNTAYNPLTIEGKKSGAYDLLLGFGEEMPDSIFVPVGDGVIIAGLYKGLWELKELGRIENLPGLIAIQASGSDALFRYFETGVFELKPAETVADSICAAAPRNLYMAADSIKKTAGDVLAVSDSEILAAQQIAASQFGYLIEPAAAASLAGYLKYQQEGKISRKEKILLMFTGNGLKDFGALKKWIGAPPAHSPEEWREIFL